VLNITLKYDSGTIIISGIGHIPYSTYDSRSGVFRAQALYYQNIVDYLKQSELSYEDRVLDLIPSPPILTDPKLAHQNGISLRDYQTYALESWLRAKKRGCVVLPTGSGKTIIGLKALEKVNASSLVVVPTIDLMDQWTSVLSKFFAYSDAIKIGNLGGGSDNIETITVSTYDSAYLRAASFGNRFALVIFDEVHHLAAPGYRLIAEQLASPFRLGLTATIEREDDLHKELPRLVGGVVYQVHPRDLAKNRHLAMYEIERREVDMLPEEVEEYKKWIGIYQTGLKKVGLRMAYAGAFQKLIIMSGRNKVAREALLARSRAIEIALNSKSKLEELRKILEQNKGRKTIIFTQHNKLVYDISDRFLIPFITYKSGKEERQDALSGFKDGRYKAIVTSKVLDEGVDVPDAEVGIIVSGTGSSREFIQRLGRLLRPKADSNIKAKLIEIISANTREIETSARRKRAFSKNIDSGNR
jgi:superfamily II DNA or RNA helicase